MGKQVISEDYLRDFLRNRFIAFQNKIIDLNHHLLSEKNQYIKNEKSLYLELIEVIDSFENVFNSLKEKEHELDNTTRMMLKSFKAIYNKILRILEGKGITKIEFPNQKAIFGFCKVVGTKEVSNMENERILSLLKNGYIKDNREVIRLAEVITVHNTKGPK